VGRHLDIGVFGVRGIPSTYSGYETFLTALLPEIAARGHRVTIYCRSEVSREGGDFQDVRRRWLPSIASKQLDTMTHGLLSALQAVRAHHDVLLVCNVANVPYLAILTRLGQRVILNTDGQEWLRTKWGATARRYFRLCAQAAGRSANALIADCNAMRDIYLRTFGADSSVIPYCWNSITNPSAPSGGIGGSRSLSPDEYFVTGGRLVPENNIHHIARAYVMTSCPMPLVVLGRANYRSPVIDELRELARQDPRLRLLGHVDSREEFQSILRNARAYLHGHSVGGMNPSLVEAMASGAVIAALDTPFNREVLGETGLYFTSDSESIRAAIRLLDRESADARERYRSTIRERAMQRFDLAAVADAYEELLLAAAKSAVRSRVRITTKWEIAPQ
jgi:glycosyltransferase involved in cell wall biosynthesis